MRKLAFYIMAIVASTTIVGAKSPSLKHVQPEFWWAGMTNPVVQVLLHGEDIGHLDVSLDGATGVSVDRVVRPSNPNYLLVYLDTEGAAPQSFKIKLSAAGSSKKRPRLTVDYELRSREGRYRHAQRYRETGRLSWDADDVVYLLMPDRFANGNTENDVVAGLREQVCDPSVPDARHGGDMAGIVDHLDYLADLGVTAIWHTPMHINDMPGYSYHGYAITDYYTMDPRYGSNAEYRSMVDAAHDRGIKVIMDLVFNHCGSECFLFRDMPDTTWFNHGPNYVQTNYKTGATGDPHASALDRALSVDGWFVETMPDWNQRNPDVSTYLIQSSIWWVEYAGIDGIRQDTYPYADMEAMGHWCEALQAEYPGFNVVGETWVNHPVGVAFWQAGSRLAAPRDSHLPTVMDFPLMAAINQAVDEETDEWSKGLARIYELLSQDAVYENTNHLLTFVDNHDTDRFAPSADKARRVERYRQALTLLATLRGTPQLYYGDEIAMAADKSRGDGALRQDFEAFDAAARLPYQNSTHDFARRLLTWRKSCPAVQFGTLTHFAIRHTVYAYARRLDGHTVTVIINGSDQPATVDLAPYAEILPADGATVSDVLGGVSTAWSDSTTMTLEPRGVRIIEF